ncbi:MAG: glycoside hydrolase family 28 protein [Clostridia bacterium]|nr:glycoside hydrolase family 28 protein [Clostridia bacterium]
MLKALLFEDGLVLYWDRPQECEKGYRYCVCYGNERAYANSTHFEIKNLSPESTVQVAVSLVDGNGNLIKEIDRKTFELPKAKKRIDITKPPYLAVGDGTTLQTECIQRAFDDCRPDECVYFPKGVYLTGALDVHSDTEIYLDEGAVLQGTDKVEDYLPKIKSRFEGTELMCYRSLINMGTLDRSGGYTCKNVVLRGKGAIIGGGKPLKENIIAVGKKEMLETYGTDEYNGMTPDRMRGRLINMSNAQNIVIYGLEAADGPAWNIHMIYSDRIVTAGCFIHSDNIENGDGWDPDSSTNCTLFDCDFRTRDDMVAIKSGKNPEGNLIDRPSKNIKVFDCRCSRGHGLAVGSEMSGGVSGVYVWDCDIENSRCGLEIKGTKKRGGYVKNVHVANVASSIIAIRSVEYNDDGKGAKTPPIFENFCFKDVSVTGVYVLHTGEKHTCSPIILEGFGEKYCLRNVLFENVTIKHAADQPTDAINLRFAKNVIVKNLVFES